MEGVARQKSERPGNAPDLHHKGRIFRERPGLRRTQSITEYRKVAGKIFSGPLRHPLKGRVKELLGSRVSIREHPLASICNYDN
jgi:hypothetical protein